MYSHYSCHVIKTAQSLTTHVEMIAGNFPYRVNERKLHVSMCDKENVVYYQFQEGKVFPLPYIRLRLHSLPVKH